MSTDPAHPSAADAPGDFGIELDDELLAAALEAVERSGGARKHRAGPPADGPSLVDDDATASLTEGLDVELEVELDLAPAAAAQAPEPAPGDAADIAHLQRVITSLSHESEALRAELSGQQDKLRASETERRRLLGAQRRLEEQLMRANAATEQAMVARRASEESSANLRRRLEQLESELQALRERRRREQEEQRLFGHARMVEAILPVLDNLELALGHQGAEPARLIAGVEMILQQFHQAVHQLGVSRVVAGCGVLFDPEVHEAVSEVLTEELLPGSVVEEVRPGYALHGRLLRAARVTVASFPDPALTAGADPAPTGDDPAADATSLAEPADAPPPAEAGEPAPPPTADGAPETAL